MHDQRVGAQAVPVTSASLVYDVDLLCSNCSLKRLFIDTI